MKRLKIPHSYFETIQQFTQSRVFLSPLVQKEFHNSFPEKGYLRFIFCVPHENELNIAENDIKKWTEIHPLLSFQKYSTNKLRRDCSLLLIEIRASYLGIPPSVMKKRLGKGKRGLSLMEGIWMTMFMPSILNRQAIDLLESTYSIECIPTIYRWKKKTFLSAVCPDVSDAMCGAPIVKKEVLLTTDDLSHPNIFVRKIRSLRSAYFK